MHQLEPVRRDALHAALIGQHRQQPPRQLCGVAGAKEKPGDSFIDDFCHAFQIGGEHWLAIAHRHQDDTALVDLPVGQHDEIRRSVVRGDRVIRDVTNVGNAMAAQAQGVDLLLISGEVLPPHLAGNHQHDVRHGVLDRGQCIEQKVQSFHLLDLPEEQQHLRVRRQAQLRTRAADRGQGADIAEVVAMRDHVDLPLGNAEFLHQLPLAHQIVGNDAVRQAIDPGLEARPLAPKGLDVMRGDDHPDQQRLRQNDVEEFENADLKKMEMGQPAAAVSRAYQGAQASAQVPQAAPPGRITTENATVDELHAKGKAGHDFGRVAGVQRGRDPRSHQASTQAEVVVVHATVAPHRFDDGG